MKMFNQKKRIAELEAEIEALKTRIYSLEREQTAHTFDYGDVTLKTLAKKCQEQKRDIQLLAKIFDDIQETIGNRKSLSDGIR